MLKQLIVMVNKIKEKQVCKEDLITRTEVKEIVDEAIEGKLKKSLRELKEDNEKLNNMMIALEYRGPVKPSRETTSGGTQNDTSLAFLNGGKSIKFQPCKPTRTDVRKFKGKELGIDRETVETIEINLIKPFVDRKKRLRKNNGKIAGPKTLVRFGSINERDAVFSYATELRKGCSLDLVIPDHLNTLATKMEHYAYKVRQLAKNSETDPKNVTTTQIRHNTRKEGLVLGMKTTKNQEWIFTEWENLPNMDTSDEEEDEEEDDDGMSTHE